MRFVIDTDVIKERIATAKGSASTSKPAAQLKAGANKVLDSIVNNWEDYALALTAIVLGAQVAENADDIETITEDFPHR
tara:strand:+ start:435 stop:671 length:237 start_codon:yes stop_codon:yes gene_type:complete